jgi:hypothetical protein
MEEQPIGSMEGSWDMSSHSSQIEDLAVMRGKAERMHPARRLCLGCSGGVEGNDPMRKWCSRCNEQKEEERTWTIASLKWNEGKDQWIKICVPRGILVDEEDIPLEKGAGQSCVGDLHRRAAILKEGGKNEAILRYREKQKGGASESKGEKELARLREVAEAREREERYEEARKAAAVVGAEQRQKREYAIRREAR